MRSNSKERGSSMCNLRRVVWLAGQVSLLVVLAGCTASPASPASLLASPAPGAALAPGTEPALPDGWQRYVDPAGRFAFAYPPGAHLSASQDAAGTSTVRIQFSLPGVAGYQGLLIRSEPNPQGAGIERVLDALYTLSDQEMPPEQWLAAAQSIAVAGLPALRASLSGEDFLVAFPYRDRIYVLAPVHDVAMASVDPQALDLFHQVLASFVVTK
jgi:hypothetical protein